MLAFARSAVLAVALGSSLAWAAPMPAPSPTSPPLARSPDGPAPTAAPPVLPKDPTPNDIFSFYGPIKSGSERAGPPSNLIGGGYFDWYEPEKPAASPIRRDETPPVPLSQLPYP